MKCYYALVFLLTGALSFIGGFAIYVEVVNRLGEGRCQEEFVPKVRALKEYVAQHTASPRLFVISGSNACYSLDSAELERLVGMKVVNYSCIVAEPMRYYLSDLKRHLRTGDVLFMPLEFEHYSRDRVACIYNLFSASWVFGVNSDVRSCLSPIEQFGVYSKYGLGWICRSVHNGAKDRYAKTPEETFAAWKQQSDPFLSRHMSAYGDMFLNVPSSVLGREWSAVPALFSAEFRNNLRRVTDLANERGVRVLLGYPPLYNYPYDKKLVGFIDEQQSLGVQICGRPEAFALLLCYYAGKAYYHLNKAGAKLYTRALARELSRVLDLPLVEMEAGNQFVFRDEIGLVSAEGAIETYATGCRVECPSIRFQMVLPPECRQGEVFAELMVDRGKNGKAGVIKSVRCRGREVEFKEIVEESKNLVRFWFDNSGQDRANVEISGLSGVGYERVLVESSPRDRLEKLITLNSIGKNFRKEGPQGRCLRYLGGLSSKEVFLRVAIPNWHSNRYVAKMKFCAPARILDAAAPVGVGWRDYRFKHNHTEEMSFEVALNDTEMFVFGESGTAYVGIVVQTSALEKGDVIELTDLRFDLY